MASGLLRWFETRWAAPVYDAILPPQAEAVRRGEFWVGLAQAAPPLVIAANVAAVAAISLLPPMLIGRFSTFRSLGPDDKQRCLERLQSHGSYFLRLLLNVAKYSALLSALAAPVAHVDHAAHGS